MASFNDLPADRRADAERALAATFPGVEVRLAERLIGASALGVFHVEAGGEAYVVRLDPPADALRDPHRQAACARIASDGGVTPQVVWADAAAGISIQRFAPPVQAPWTERLEETARLVRRLHDLPLFPPFQAYAVAMASLAGTLSQSAILPAAVQARLGGLWKTALETYPWDDDLVSSHNDLNPSNIVFDGTRSWIVDWETAFAADRYIDVASLANWLTADEAAALKVLTAYLDAEPTPAQRARFFLARQINRLFYGAMLVIAASWTQPGVKVKLAQWNASQGLNPIRAEMNTLAIHGGRIKFGVAFLKDAVTALESDEFSQAAAQLRG